VEGTSGRWDTFATFSSDFPANWFSRLAADGDRQKAARNEKPRTSPLDRDRRNLRIVSHNFVPGKILALKITKRRKSRRRRSRGKEEYPSTSSSSPCAPRSLVRSFARSVCRGGNPPPLTLSLSGEEGKECGRVGGGPRAGGAQGRGQEGVAAAAAATTTTTTTTTMSTERNAGTLLSPLAE
jgi:hypothetical protein